MTPDDQEHARCATEYAADPEAQAAVAEGRAAIAAGDFITGAELDEWVEQMRPRAHAS